MSHTHAERLASLRIQAQDAPVIAQDAVPILPLVHGPEDVRSLTIPQLEQLAAEVRQRIIEVIACNGGHFGAPLGAVDLTLALLHQFDVPRDRVVWDVGHQAYAWKILTGRNEAFETIRQYGGLSGFLKRKESECDAFGAGHASTSVAAALGMAIARDCTANDYRVAAVIGDGAMTGGMAYEALNNAGLRKTRMIVVFNDNEMSIGRNVWVVHEMFRKAVTSPFYNRMRRDVVDVIKKVSPEGFINYAHRVEEALKGFFVPGLFFEEMGFRYIGPIDGHNIATMVETLEAIKDFNGPICLHVITQKGKGYKYAEKDPITYHAAANMKIETGEMAKKDGPPAYTKVFGNTLVETARKNERIVAITAAMDSGTGLDIFRKEFPSRFFDAGIAEECAVTMAAGMAADGLRPVCAIYSTFLQRAIDQVIHDVAIQDLPVFLVLDRAGIVGADGPTHHGVFDLSYLRMVPGMTIMAPRNEVEMRDMILTGIEHTGGPIAMRYPRGACLGLDTSREPRILAIGKGETLRTGKRIALIGIGSMVGVLEESAHLLEKKLGHPVTLIDARFAKPLDRELIGDAVKSHEFVFTAEDNVLAGGFGSGVNEMLGEEGIASRVIPFGIPDRFVDHGSPEELYDELGLSAERIAERIIAITAK
ncbi:MAG: 1-deoxy-D-xylulose-5-phosphate synthase [Candidatus Sumerlaeota bacterium]|nr:1-deoxy-D-xylulose-5-phosphate synthase [Candidatus Sumerlaeota bacterium]